MDVLSDAITAMRAGRPHSAMRRLRAPWNTEFPSSGGVGFHAVLQGACWFHPSDGDAVLLGAGDAVFLPHEPGHRLRAASIAPPGGGPEDQVAAEANDSAPETVLLCGAYQLDGTRTHPLWNDLPSFVHIPARIGGPTPLRAAIDLLGAELATAAPGSGAMVPALLDALLVCMLRHWIATDPAAHGRGWAAVMRDAALVAALTALHEAPARAWTVADLARAAGLSRSVFSQRFTQTVGQPPMAYLTWWRMAIAAKLLQEGDAPIAAVARRVGYTSEFAFAKAFKRELGIAPGKYRGHRP